MSNRASDVERKLERCKHCGRRVFRVVSGKYALASWMHYGYAIRECEGLTAKYATPMGARLHAQGSEL